MKDEELLSLSRQGFIPGPFESEEDFRTRIEETKLSVLKLGEELIPKSHWHWVGVRLQTLFGFDPECLPAFYSNRSLMPWQGAAAWVERGRVLAIQLRKAFRKGSFLGVYQRAEILAHESVHAARSAFPEDRWDEFFAYMTSEKSWRRAIGPIIRRPWEVWPFFLFCVLSSLTPFAFLGMAIWLGAGFIRLWKGHAILKRAAETLQKKGWSDPKIRSVLFRLTDEEIRLVAKGVSNLSDLLGKWAGTLRGRLLLLLCEG